MTAKWALCVSLLSGNVLDINKVWRETGLTNISREIGRSIERDFGVEVSKIRKDGLSRWGMPVFWFQYRLNRTEHNKEGIRKMLDYVLKNMPTNPKTSKEEIIVRDINKRANDFIFYKNLYEFGLCYKTNMLC